MYRTLQLNFLFIASLFLFTSCAAPTSTPAPVPIATFADLDEEMNKAIGQAQNTLAVLRRAMIAPKPSYAFLSVKVRFISRTGIEDMWTVPEDYIESKFVVRMVEGVTLQQGAHPDHLVEVPPDQILDWMILEKDGTVIGGYTLRLEYERLTPEQQKQYDKVTGYKFTEQ